jgi:RHS repeat-associated protein
MPKVAYIAWEDDESMEVIPAAVESVIATQELEPALLTTADTMVIPPSWWLEEIGWLSESWKPQPTTDIGVTSTLAPVTLHVNHPIFFLPEPQPAAGPLLAPSALQGRVITTTITYTYDPLNRLKTATYSDGTSFQYTYDAVGNRLTETTTGSTTINYTYDNANRLTSVDGVAYTWDNNGNLLDDGVNTYAYDHANRLESVYGLQGTDNYFYNGLGDRLYQTINTTPYWFTMDLNNGLTQVLSDSRSTYLYGVGRIAQEGTGGIQYFLGDGLGSVRQLVDEDALLLAKSYEPFGKVLGSEGSGVSSFGYDGEWTTRFADMVYLRSRYYTPSTGRFLTRDTWRGDSNKPMSYNAWLYGHANPVNFTDPSGMISCYNGDDTNCRISAELVRQFAEAIKIGVENGAFLPVEGFARTVDFAYWLFDNDYRGMMWALTHVINGMDANEGTIFSQVGSGGKSTYFIHQDWLPYKHNPQYDDPNWGGGERGIWIHSLRGDWNEAYWDKTANQAYHFWFYAAVAFFDGPFWAVLGNLIHDPPPWDVIDFTNEFLPPPKSGKTEPDYRLGISGKDFGSRIRGEFMAYYYQSRCPSGHWPSISFDPGNWIRANLR